MGCENSDPLSCLQCCEYSRDYDEQINWDLMPERVREQALFD